MMNVESAFGMHSLDDWLFAFTRLMASSIVTKTASPTVFPSSTRSNKLRWCIDPGLTYARSIANRLNSLIALDQPDFLNLDARGHRQRLLPNLGGNLVLRATPVVDAEFRQPGQRRFVE